MPQFIIKKLEDWFLNLNVEIAREVYVSKTNIKFWFSIGVSLGFTFPF